MLDLGPDTKQLNKYIYDHSFVGGFGQEFFPSRPQYAILGSGILGQIASFEHRLRGAAPTPLALLSVPHLAGIGYVG